MSDSLFFSCGQIISKDSVAIAAQYNALPDEDMSRMALKLGDDWVYYDVDDDSISSTSYDPTTETLWMIGRHGRIRRVSSGGAGFSLENIKGKFMSEILDTKNLGELLGSAAINGAVFVVGQSRQIYERIGSSWQCSAPNLLEMAAPALESIHGLSKNKIYAVGEKGSIYSSRDGEWEQMDSPTNANLSAVRCASDNSFYICGNRGTFIEGSGDSLAVIGGISPEIIFWDVEIFQGRVYLAHSNGLIEYDGRSLRSVDVGIGQPIRCHKLHASEGRLWSFGIDDLMFFDGKTWSYVTCPHNA